MNKLRSKDYQITWKESQELIISVIKKRQKIVVYAFLFFNLQILGALWLNLDMEVIGIQFYFVFVLTLCSVLSYPLIYKLSKAEDEYVFNPAYNSIVVNNKIIGRIDDLRAINIIENIKSKSGLYSLQLCLGDTETIVFKESNKLTSLSEISEAVSKISGIPFCFMDNPEGIKEN